MFLLSEAVFFFLLVAAYVYFRAGSLAAASANLRLGAAALFTLCLLASSFTMWRAVVTRVRGWLIGTVALGALFLIGQGTEYSRLIGQKITISQSLFGTTFFTLTGMHGIHVLAGIVTLGAVLLLARQGEERESGLLDAVAMYWYFVDGVWIVIFTVVYLGSLL
jgi:heme/copper-type cytochrome/quinol oxidase subunit 3